MTVSIQEVKSYKELKGIPLVSFYNPAHLIYCEGFLDENEHPIKDVFLNYAYKVTNRDIAPAFATNEVIYLEESENIDVDDIILVVTEHMITGQKHVYIGICNKLSLVGQYYYLEIQLGDQNDLKKICSSEVAFVAKVLPYFARPD